MPRELQPCGTPAAYRRHLRHGETTCEACCAAQAAAQRERRPATVRGRYGKPECGTYSGYMAHRYRREGTCQPCRDALSRHQQEYNARRAAKEVASNAA